MTKTRRRAPVAATKAPGPGRRRRGAEPNAGIKAELKEKLTPAAGAHEPIDKPKMAAAVTTVEPSATEGAEATGASIASPTSPALVQAAPAQAPGPAAPVVRPRGLADPSAG